MSEEKEFDVIYALHEGMKDVLKLIAMVGAIFGLGFLMKFFYNHCFICYRITIFLMMFVLVSIIVIMYVLFFALERLTKNMNL